MPEVFLFLTEARSPSRFSGSRSSHRSHSSFFPHALLLRIFVSCPSCSCQLVAPGVLTQVVCSSFSVSLHPLSLYAETQAHCLGFPPISLSPSQPVWCASVRLEGISEEPLSDVSAWTSALLPQRGKQRFLRGNIATLLLSIVTSSCW